MYEQCSQALGHAAFYREHGCPCAFPCFGQLVQFDFNHYTQGPVGCHATEIAIALVTAKDSPPGRKLITFQRCRWLKHET